MTVGVDMKSELDGEHIIEEQENYSRSVVSLLANAAILKRGTVLGKRTADDKYVPLNPAAGDGSEVAAAVLFGRQAISTVDTDVLVHNRDNVVMNGFKLEWPATITPAQEAAAVAELEALGILVRK